MNKTGNLTLRIEPELKKSVEEKLKEMGITMAQAIHMFFKQIDMTDSIPFAVKMHRYNAETLKAMQETKDRKNLIGPFKTVAEMWEDLERRIEEEE